MCLRLAVVGIGMANCIAVRIEDPVVIKKILTHLEEKSSARSAFAI
jgi:hypothetical protein